MQYDVENAWKRIKETGAINRWDWQNVTSGRRQGASLSFTFRDGSRLAVGPKHMRGYRMDDGGKMHLIFSDAPSRYARP
jgi:hypothetical protein